MRVFLLLVAACVTTVAQESRPFGLLPPESPLAPIQEALMRGDAAEARAALDAILGTAAPETLAALAPEAALLRAAAEPVGQRAAAMLGVATAYADRTVSEAAAVAGLAALLSDGPEVGDLSDPLLPRPDGLNRDRSDTVRPTGSGAPSRDHLLSAFLEVLEQRAVAPGRDVAAIEHAKRLLAQFPSQSGDWIRVRPCAPVRFPARLDDSLRLRFYEIGRGGALPDPSQLMLPDGPPRVDLTLPANNDGLELPALEPGAWLVVATGSDGTYRRAWPVLVSDLELIAHSVPGKLESLALLGNKPAPEVSLTKFFDARLASRTRGSQPRDPDNAVLARSGAQVTTASIASQPAPPDPLPRLIADLWAAQPVYYAGDPVRMRLVLRPLGRGAPAEAPIRIVLWPRQPHELVIEKQLAAVIPIDVELPLSAPHGPVRAQVFDTDWKPAGGLAPEPILDTIAFTVQAAAVDPVQLLMSGPVSWKTGDPAPRIELLGLFQDGSPVAGFSASVVISAGSFHQDVSLVLDGDGGGSVTLALDKIAESALARVPHIDVSARLLAGAVEIAKASRRITLARVPLEEDAPTLRMTVLTPKPVGGEPMRLAITGPPGEWVLLTVASRTHLAPQTVDLGPAGAAEVSIATDRAWWPAVEIVGSTRSLRGGRIDKRIQLTLSRPDAPTIAIETDKTDYLAGEDAKVTLRVTSKTPLAHTTVSLAVVDDRLLRFAGCGVPDPDAALRPRTVPLSVWATSSPSPLEAAAWYASVLAREDRVSVMPVDARGSVTGAGRGWPRGPIGSSAQDVGDFTFATAWGAESFVANLELDFEGRSSFTHQLTSRGTWRVIVVAVDREGRSSVATATISKKETDRETPGFDPFEAYTPRPRATTARVSLGAGEPTTRGEAGRKFAASVRLRPIAAAKDGGVGLEFFPIPLGIPTVLKDEIDRTTLPVGDHIAARVMREASALGRAAKPGRGPSSQQRAALLQTIGTDLALLRDLKTQDGYSWKRGEPTDFELTPFVLQALSTAADAGVDPAAFSAVPDVRDGFLRVALRALSEAQGNAQAALDLEDIRNHVAFKKTVSADRQTVVLMETVIGMLAVDPTAALPKSSLAVLVRQIRELPIGLIGRAGRALFRAGDKDSAALALARMQQMRREGASPDSRTSGETTIARLAIELELAQLLETPAEETETLARELARICAQESWPTVPDAARALVALRSIWGPLGFTPSWSKALGESGSPDLKIESDAPALCVARRWHEFEKGLGPPSAENAPARKLLVFDQDVWDALPDGPVSMSRGTIFRIALAVDAPAGIPVVIKCPLPPGTTVLQALEATRDAEPHEEGAGLQFLEWIIRAPVAGQQTRVEALLIASTPVSAVWPPCELITLDTLEVLGWSASSHFEVTQGPPATWHPAAAKSTATAFDLAALAKAREEIVKAIQDASDRDTTAKALRELLELPDPAVADALVAALPKIAPFLDSTDVVVPVLIALGNRRGELWSPANVAHVTADGRRARSLAELAHAYPEARDLVTRWVSADGNLEVSQNRLAGLMTLARLRSSDPGVSSGLWDPNALLRLWIGDDLKDEAARAERIAASTELPFQRNFSRMFGGTRPVSETECADWIRLLDFVERSVRAPGATQDLLALAAAITERSPQEVGLFTRPEMAFRIRQGELRILASDRAVEMLESGALPLEAAGLPLLTSVAAADHVARVLRVLTAAVEAGRAEPAIPLGVSVLERHRDSFATGDRAGAMLAVIASSGPRAWRLPAILALAAQERRRIPIVAIAPLLRDPDARSAAIDLLLERDDSADLLRNTLEQKPFRHEARLILEKLAALEPRPFERTPLARLMVLLATLDGESARLVEEETRRRAEEAPAEIARALAASREERAREVLVQILGRQRFTDVPWEGTDPLADGLRIKLLALAGDADAAIQIRQWMAAAVQASPSQRGSPDPVVQELWPYLAGHATPSDVLAFGAPSPIESLASRAAAWTDADIADFLRSPEARPDAASTSEHWGAVAIVVKLMGPVRAARFSDDLLSLWRASVDAGLAFDALSLFGQMGSAQIAVLREVMEPGSPGDSKPARTTEQRLGYIAALSRDPAIHREAEPILRAVRSDEVATALARYTLEVTGYWKEPATSATRPAPGPRTPEEWQRVLATRLRNEGLGAIARAEPAILGAWEKTLRERGLLAR